MDVTPASKGVMEVSGLGMEMDARGTPMVSAAIWAKTVFCPAPISTLLERRVRVPSGFTLMKHEDSVGVAVPLIVAARPLPRKRVPSGFGLDGGQPISRLALKRGSRRPTACMNRSLM